jgi:2'-5' RNA ligase
MKKILLPNEPNRIFVAVPLPDLVRQELSRLVTYLKKEKLCDGNYVNPAVAHITIQFIGLVLQQEISEIHAALQTISYPAFPAALGPLDYFAKRGHPSIVHVAVQSKGLEDLAILIRNAVASWVQKDDSKNFVGHITLLRIKKIYDQDALRTFLDTAIVQPIVWNVDSFMLMQSILLPDGPQYTVLHEYRLG